MALASNIVEMIRKAGGQFLGRVGASLQGQDLWEDIGDDKAREKTSQALRDGAAESRELKEASAEWSVEEDGA